MGGGNWFVGTKPKIKQMSMWNPEQQAAQAGLGSYLTRGMGQYGGAGGVGEQTYNLLSQYLAGTDPMAQTAEGLLMKTMGGGGLEPEATRGYLQNVIRGPMEQTLAEQTLPGIAASYGKGGAYFSTARAGAESRARETMEEQFGRISEEIAYQELMASKQRQMQAMGMGLQYPGMKAGLGMQYGQGLMGQIQQYLQQQPYQYVVRPGTEGLGKSIIGAIGGLAGGALCHIVSELYGLDTPRGFVLFNLVNFKWPKTYIGSVLNKLYRKYSKPISVFISKKGIINRTTRSVLKRFFDYEFQKEIKNACSNLYAT